MATTTEQSTASQTVERPGQGSSFAILGRYLVMGSDAVALALGVVASLRLMGSDAIAWSLCLVFAATCWLWMIASRLYNSRLVTDRREELSRVARSGVRSLLMLGALSLLTDREVSLRAAVTLTVVTVLIVSLEREILRHWFARRRRSGQGVWSSILVAETEDGTVLRDAIQSDPSSPHDVLGLLDPTELASEEEVLTRSVGLARELGAKGVVVVESSLDASTTNSLVRGLLEAGLYVDLASSLAGISTDRLATRNLGPGLATWIAPRPRGGWRAHAKRGFDTAVAAMVLAAVSPVLIAIALSVKLTSPGPIFFRQERIGQNGEPFHMLKFRSMVVDAEERLKQLQEQNEGAGPLFKMKDDPRVTRIGGFLRKTSLDELPQLINVIRNEMSLVGPRPALRSEMAQWAPALYDRLQVKPGITGMWQVSGRSGTSFDEYTRLDLYYVHNWSLAVDLSILARTVPAVVKSDGAF